MVPWDTDTLAVAVAVPIPGHTPGNTGQIQPVVYRNLNITTDDVPARGPGPGHDYGPA